MSVAPGVLEQLAKAEADRKQNGAKAAGVEMTDKELDEADARISDVMVWSAYQSVCMCLR